MFIFLVFYLHRKHNKDGRKRIMGFPELLSAKLSSERGNGLMINIILTVLYIIIVGLFTK